MQMFEKEFQILNELLEQEDNGKTFLITGATGLIGKTLIRFLLAWNAKAKQKLKIIALVRDLKKLMFWRRGRRLRIPSGRC